MLKKGLLLFGLIALFGCAHAKPADTPLVAPGICPMRSCILQSDSANISL